ncbi:glycoside hydrolase family 38 N-terminal domain-containing protein [Edaphobacter albus]|uniref:glycoside hydrolase family 38 N-terminal domain-containing protein n=1 Tax=Edaphobacter sp. 4G125 TaxID=2763071 RepID=UPI001C99177D|nr:glycoside hydrolase family 38 C-terminal domain-containing protein [Edaphobacter sp. 4G125]
MAVTKLDGVEIDRRDLATGSTIYELYLKPVSAVQRSTISVEINSKITIEEIERKPVRQMLIYVLPHSHHDLGYTDLQANVEEKQIRNITRGIELARKTASYPDGAKFVWNLEVLWGADLYMRRGTESARRDLIDAVRKGWIGVNGSYANELTGLCRPEELLQLFRYSGQFGQMCGVEVNSAMMSDVPGFSWGMVTAMSQAGIRYFSAAPNYFDRIGTFMVTWQDKPFWWISPSGNEKVLFWIPWTGYALSHVMKLGNDLVSKYQDRMDEIHYPYDISYIRWSGHGDNAEPDVELSDWIRDWNQKYEWPRFSIASTTTAFSDFEKRYGTQLPHFRGDLTPYWEDGAGSSALETAINRNAADRISEAAALAAIKNFNTYNPAAYADAWRDVLLYSEHTWGAWNSVSDSEKPFVKQQWDVKRAFAIDAEKQSNALLEKAASESIHSAPSNMIEIQNASSWRRTEMVYLSHNISEVGDHVTDSHGNPIASQRMSTGELALLTTDVPAFGTSHYTLSAHKEHIPANPVSYKNYRLSNGIVDVLIDPSNGDIAAMHLHSEEQNLVDTKKHRLNQFLFLEGSNKDHLRSSGPSNIVVEDPGPLVVSVRIESSAPGCKSLTRRIRLGAGMDYVEISNTVDKLQAPLNPHPGIGGPGDEFAQRGSKESLQFAFPLSIPNGEMTIDIALGNMRPEADQLPGSCKNWIPIGRWLDISNKNIGVTWITLDAPLIEIGEISATMLGSQRDPTVWRKHIDKTQTFYSWVMNNHWGTNYRAYQEGAVTFRYALRPHRGYDAAAASRLAMGLSEPLLVQKSSSSPASPLLLVEPSDVIVVTLKPSEDRKAWIIRLFGASGEDRTVKLVWASSRTGNSWRSNLAEEQLEPVGNEIHVSGWELVTLRVEKKM